MDFLNISDISLRPNYSIGTLCEDLNKILGLGIWYDTFKIQNNKWLWFVNNIVTTLNGDNALCGTFGLYPSYLAGILNSVHQIDFYVLCNEQIKYSELIEKCIAGTECSYKLYVDFSAYMKTCIPGKKFNFKLYAENTFKLTFGCDTVKISFHERLIRGQAPPTLVFAQNALNEIRISALAYAIVCVKNRITYITNETLTSKHECTFGKRGMDLNTPRQLASCKLHSSLCTVYPHKRDLFGGRALFCSKPSHKRFWKNECSCKLCVKAGPASLKSLCVNKPWSLPAKYRQYKL
jgi:hypothetical protein